MKQIIVVIVFISVNINCFSQNTEFGKSGNGLIYSDGTIKQLRHIVDSLNLKFKVCDLHPIYQSKFQGKANFITLETGNIKDAKKDIEAGISFQEFIKKYSKSACEYDLLVVKFNYKDYHEKDVVEFSSISMGDKYQHEFTFDKNLKEYNESLEGKWIYRYSDKTTYSKESIDAFYFTRELVQQPLPETYAKMIQYSECMVDTSTQVFYDKAHRSGFRYDNNKAPAVQKFMDYISKSTNKPKYGGKNYWKKYQSWDSLRIRKVTALKQSDDNFMKLLTGAVKEAIENGDTDDEFEEYVALFYSQKTALELKRNRRVVGMCSQDVSPRVHALNIAKLSAETTNWEIFLRSHLDIMNDRFERASDGSYAWGQRSTYIKELEVLDINVLDLLLGISLRIENAATNHYYGNIGRLGRALAETEKAGEIESKMLQMISDNQLDDYNRIMVYYLFLNYNYNLTNKIKQVENKAKLMTAIHTLPKYLSQKIGSEK